MTDIYIDDNRFSGRMRRYARVGGAVSGVAARFATKRLGFSIDDDRYAGELRAALGGVKGPLMKLAQILATIPDALPKEYAEELRQLQANAPAMGWPFVKRRMTTELGAGWRSKFDEFSREALAAASLGQVHKATTLDGETVACKLQYPDMSSAVEADLKQLQLIFSIYRRYDRAVDTSDIHDELSARLREELDYDREAKHMRLYRHMLADEPNVHIPEPVDDLCTDRLLTMSWLDGAPFMTAKTLDLEARNTVALNMFLAWYAPFYGYGVIHGDPHMGNYALRPDHGVNLLDFGCIRVFPPAFVKGVIDLYIALRDDQPDMAVEAYRGWGFTDLRREVIDVLNIWANFIYEPLFDDRVKKISEHENALYGAEVAAKVHAELRKIGGVKPPREFVFMDRAAIGLGSVFMHLAAEINWRREFEALVDDFDVGALAERQSQALQSVGLSAPA